MDSGADTSLVKRISLAEGVKVDSMAFEGLCRTVGAWNMPSMRGCQSKCIALMKSLRGDGVLGRDHLWGRSVMDTRALVLRIYSEGGKWSLPFIPLRDLEGSYTVSPTEDPSLFNYLNGVIKLNKTKGLSY